MMLISSIAKSFLQGLLFKYLNRFFNPELLMGLIFTCSLIGYNYFPETFLIGCSNAILLEFVILHANFFSILAALSSPNQETFTKRQIKINSFYLFFIIAFGIGLNAWFFVLNYFWLLHYRLQLTISATIKKDLFQNGVHTIFRIFLFLVTGLIAGITNAIVSADDTFTLLLWGLLFYGFVFATRNSLRNFFDKIPLNKSLRIIELFSNHFNKKFNP